MKDSILRPIVLVGMVGSGKSTVGKRLARKLNLPFYDSDKVIEKREGLSVVDIYDFKGKDYFAQKEEEVIKEIFGYGVFVLSTGGSTFFNQTLRSLIKQNATSVCLSASIDVLHERVLRRDTRPEFLNCDNKREILERMIQESQEVYSDADIVVESSKNQDIYYVVDTIIARLRKHLHIAE